MVTTPLFIIFLYFLHITQLNHFFFLDRRSSSMRLRQNATSQTDPRGRIGRVLPAPNIEEY